IHCAREDRLEPFGIFRCTPAGLTAGISLEMVAAIFGDVAIIVPEMLLPLHALDGGPLLFPHGRDVEEGVGLPVHLLGLVRLEQVDLRRAEDLLAGIMPPGLRNRAAF